MQTTSRGLAGRVHCLLACPAAILIAAQLRADSPIELAAEPGPWAFSVGTIVRSIDADFHLSPPGPLNFGGLLRSGLGEVGLSNGSARTYDNGSVIPSTFLILPGSGFDPAYGGRVTKTGRVDVALDPISRFDFFTHSFDSSFSSRSVDVSDSDVGVGPYLELSRRVWDAPSLIVDAFIGWTYVETEHSSCDHTLATQTLTDTLHTYSYEGVTIADLFQGKGRSRFPAAVSGIVVTNPAILASHGVTGYRNPSHSDSTSVMARFYAVTRGDLDVHLNEMPIGVKVGTRFGRITVLVELGGTLNVIDYDLDASTTWHRGNGSTYSHQAWQDHGSPVKAGVFSGLAVQFDLTSNGRVFVEAHSTYRWVDAIHASAGPVSTKIDVSSWEGGVSLGVRL